MLETLDKEADVGYNVSMEYSIFASPSLDYRSLGENVEDKDNQQVRIRKLIWMSAMLECEGTFTFQYNEQNRKGKIHSHLQPRIIFVNSDQKLVNAFQNLAAEFGYEMYRRDGIKSGMGEKEKSELQYNGFKTLPFLHQLKPFMIGVKLELLDLLIRFIEYRQSLDRPKQIYSDFEFGLFRRVREINSGHWKRIPKFSLLTSETVRQRREDLAKIQSDLHGDVQRATEMIAPPTAW
jgi:hypothetical protein